MPLGPIYRLQWGLAGIVQAKILREIVLEGQKQLPGPLQSVPAAAQLIYRQQPSWFWPSGRQAPPVWVAAGQSRKLIFAKWQNSKQAHSSCTRSRILRRSNLLHLKGPAGATCLAKCPMSQTLIFAAEMYYVHTALEFVFSDPLREISSKIDSCSLTATFSRASFALRFEGTK